jgi:hypothetical protein
VGDITVFELSMKLDKFKIYCSHQFLFEGTEFSVSFHSIINDLQLGVWRQGTIHSHLQTDMTSAHSLFLERVGSQRNFLDNVLDLAWKF